MYYEQKDCISLFYILFFVK